MLQTGAAAALAVPAPAVRLYRGRVLDEAGAPVPAFRVGPLEVQAADGRFLLRVRPEGDTVSFSVEAPGLAMATVVRPVDAQDVGDIVLRAAPQVRGLVREANGTPAPGALVVCEGCRGEAAGERHLTALADSEGHFSLNITGPYGVLVRLLARKDGRVGWAEAGRVGEAPLLTLAEPQPVAGRVLRPDGKPAPGVAVAFSEPLLEPVLLVSASDGSFSGRLPPGLYQVTLRPDTSQPQRTWTVQVPLQHALELATGAAP
ncbi:MAG: carboxypeptidase-like regulatory domain-containing protein [Myxococcaceae bacterium]